jgi:CheY-like chemotaxis protein
MKIRLNCPGCDAAYQMERERLSQGAIRFTCHKCAQRCKVKMSGATLTITPLTSGEALCPNCGHSFRPEAVQFAPRGRQRILVAEDHDFFLQMAQDALSKKYETVSVKTAEAAQREIERCHPDLLVLDLMLADGDRGLDILRAFRDRKFPVLVYTSRDEEQVYGKLWNTLKELGVNDILIKGMNVGDELRRKVESLLQSSN